MPAKKLLFVTTSSVRNGVRVKVTRWADGSGTTVEASCQCFGSPFRPHSVVSCPNRAPEDRSTTQIFSSCEASRQRYTEDRR